MAPKEVEVTKAEVEAKQETKDVEMKDAEKDEQAGTAAEVQKSDEPEAEKPKEPEKPKELEEDSKVDKRAKVKDGAVVMNFADSTMNVMPIAGGKLLMTLTDGGMQYLLAGVRGTAGMKSGRYMFEVKIVESLSPAETQGNGSANTPQPRQLVRVGFSLASSSLFLSDGPDNVCFDSEGYFIHGKDRKKASQKFARDQTVAVLLNLDASSPNANTISLFRNGVRISEPQPLPENLRGKVLYPTINYKNVTLQINLGPSPRQPLPFSCRMLADAASADVELAKLPVAGAKNEVVFPVGLPEQGFFDWVDDFVEKNPGYTELSDRKMQEWAYKSGVYRAKAQGGSNDKPSMKTGIPLMDDLSISRVLQAIAPTLKRNYVVAELKSNLLVKDREKALANFGDFKKKAMVVMGEPSADYKKKVQTLILAEKEAKIDQERKKKTQDLERQRLLEERKKKADEAKKTREAAQRKKDGKEEDEAKAEEPKAEEEAKAEEELPPAELTEEEKKLSYRKSNMPDLSDSVLASSYASFSVPSKAEGFDDVTFAWQPEAACTSLLQAWVLEKKLTSRAEDLTPGESFKEAWTKWQKTLAEWRRRQTEYKDPAKRKAAQAKKLADAKKKLEEEKKKLIEAGDEDGAKALDAQAEQEAKPMEIDMENLDVFTVADITDIGNGAPLFAEFLYEDWTLLATRYELHLLLHSFKKDLNDTDRPSFGEKHLAYYYNKYTKRTWNLQQFGTKTFEDFIELVKDTVTVDSARGFLKAEQAEDTPIETFLKLTEDHRRERERRIDAGDETAALKFSRPAPPGAARPAGGKGDSKGGGGYKGDFKGGSGGKADYRSSSGNKGDSKGGSGVKGSYASSGKGYPSTPRDSYGSSAPSSYGAQKRPYSQPPSSSYPSAAKQPRTAYGGGGYGGGSGGGGGGSSYYSRR